MRWAYSENPEKPKTIEKSWKQVTQLYAKCWNNWAQGIVRSRATEENRKSLGRVSGDRSRKAQKRAQLRSDGVVYNVNKSDSVK